MAKVKEISSESGDPHMRIEKYLFRQVSHACFIALTLSACIPSELRLQFERMADFDTIDATLASLSQSYPSSAVVLVTRTEYLM
jgi:hypothetical protein